MPGRKICIKQHDVTDCGAACISSVASYYGLSVPIAKLRFMAGTDQKGTNLLGMIEAAEEIGFLAKAVRTNPEYLDKLPLPFIAHVKTAGNLTHYIVVYKTAGKHLSIMDPSSGTIERVKKTEFYEKWTKIVIVLTPAAAFTVGDKTITLWQRFLDLIKPHKYILLSTLTGACFYSILGLSTSVYIEKLIDNIIPSGNTNFLNLITIILLVLLFFRVFTGWIKGMLILEIGVKVDAALITAYYRHILSLPQKFFDTMRTGEIISRINDAVKIRIFISSVATDLVIDIMIIVFTMILMLIYSWKLSLIILFSIPVSALIYYIYNRFNKKLLRKTMEHSAILESHLVETLSNINTIKRFNLKHLTGTRLESRFINLIESVFKANRCTVNTLSFNELIINTSTVLLLWAGTKMLFKMELTPGELMSFYALFAYLIKPVNNIISSNRIIQDALIAADRLYQIMDLEQDRINHSDILISKYNFQGINFENVTFRYGNGRNILQDVDLSIHPGQITGIAGESGSGKSTILSLIQGIYRTKSGKIKFGKYDLNFINKQELSEFISIVPQKVDIFNASLLENITLFHPSPDIEKVFNILNELGMNELLNLLPDNIYTFIGENGVNLSGGEKQKIAFARVLYKDPEIILLDEATSSLDHKSEQYLIKCIKNLKTLGKTIVIITHRLSTLQHADMIYFLSGGKIIDSGTHHYLIKSNGDYAEFWRNNSPCLNYPD